MSLDPTKRPAWAAPAARIAALGAVVLVVFYTPLLSPSAVLVARDLPFLHLPLRATFAELAPTGLPQWNPGIHGGQPILSNPHYAAFYPTTWLTLAMPAHAAINLTILLHAALAFAGAWRLAERLGCRPAARALGAVAYAGGGAYVALTSTLLLFTGMAWFPWLLRWGDEILRPELDQRQIDRRHFMSAPVKLGCGLALQVLNGDPASVVVTATALAAFTVESLVREAAHRRAILRRLAGGMVLAVLLSAVQVLPTAMRLRETVRAEGLALESAARWSTRPLRLVETVFPHAWGDPMRDEEDLYFGWRLHDRQFPFLVSIYVGLLPWVLALSALVSGPLRRRPSWIVLLTVGVALGMGRHNPVYALLHEELPLLAGLRYPEKFLMLTVLALPFLAACGLERLLAARDEGRAPPRAALALAGVVATVAGALAFTLWARPDLAAGFVRAHSGAPPTAAALELGASFLRREAWLALAVAAATAALLLVARRLRPRALVLLALALTGADLWIYGHRLLTVQPAARFLRPPPLAEAARQIEGRLFTDAGFERGRPGGLRLGEPGFYQLGARVGRLDPYSGTLWGLEYALHEDFDLMMTAWARVPLAALHAEWQERERVLRLLGAWHAGALVRVRPPEEMLAELRRTGRAPLPGALEPNPHLLPRWRFVPAARRHPGLPAALAAARDAEWAVGQVEHLVDSAGPEASSYAAARLLAVEDRASRVRLRYAATGPALLVAAMTFDTGWSAAVDESPLPLVPTALGQIAVEAPGGEHVLELRYRDPWVPVGASLGLVGLLLVPLATLRGRRAPPASAA